MKRTALALTLLISLTTACKKKSQNANADATEGDPDARSVSNTEVTDTGATGYIANPAAISLTKTDANISITAAANTIVAQEGSAENVIVRVAQVSASTLDSLRNVSETSVDFSGIQLGTATVGTDGSITGSFSFTQIHPYVVIYVSNEASNTLTIFLDSMVSSPTLAMANLDNLEVDNNGILSTPLANGFLPETEPTYGPSDVITNWANTLVDGGASVGLNISTANEDAGYPATIGFQGKMYVAWQETEDGGASASQIRVKVFNGSINAASWTSIDGGLATGLNISSGMAATRPELRVFNGKLYLAWQEVENGGSSRTQIRVKVYNSNDSAPAWTSVDGNGSAGLNVNSGAHATLPQLTVVNNKLYIGWLEGAFARIKVYNGNDSSPSWSLVDGGTGFRYHALGSASNLKLVNFSEKLYILWDEWYDPNSDQEVRVRVYNGDDAAPSWTAVDGAPAPFTISALAPSNGVLLAVGSAMEFDGKLYIAAVDSGTPSLVRIFVYNGDDGSPAWTELTVATDGLNYSDNGNGDPLLNLGGSAKLIVFRGTLYVTWTETDFTGSFTDQIRMVHYNGDDASPVWTFIDGNNNSGLNVAGLNRYGESSQFCSVHGKLYVTWSEQEDGGGGQYQIRVSRGN